MNKIPCKSKKIEAKTLPADACIFGWFGRLSSAAIHSADCQFWLWSEVVDPYFIHCHIFIQKILFVVLKQLETTLWIIDVLLILIDCEQTLHHFEYSFLIDKYSCKMVNTLPSDIFQSSAILCNFNLWLTKTSCIIFCVFRITSKFGQPEHSASFVSVQPCLKVTYHL